MWLMDSLNSTANKTTTVKKHAGILQILRVVAKCWDNWSISEEEMDSLKSNFRVLRISRKMGLRQAKYSRCTEGREWVGLGRPGREAYMQVYMYKNKF